MLEVRVLPRQPCPAPSFRVASGRPAALEQDKSGIPHAAYVRQKTIDTLYSYSRHKVSIVCRRAARRTKSRQTRAAAAPPRRLLGSSGSASSAPPAPPPRRLRLRLRLRLLNRPPHSEPLPPRGAGTSEMMAGRYRDSHKQSQALTFTERASNKSGIPHETDPLAACVPGAPDRTGVSALALCRRSSSRLQRVVQRTHAAHASRHRRRSCRALELLH